MYLTLVSLFLTGKTRKSEEKCINNHLTTVARQSWMTFVCFGIAKLEYKMLNIIGYFLSISYMPMHSLLKRKIYKEKNKKQKDQNVFNMIASVYTRRCGSYRMYLEGDSPHQIVMIVCELKRFSHISNRHNMYTLMQSCNVFHTQHAIFFVTLVTYACIMWFGHHKFYMC